MAGGDPSMLENAFKEACQDESRKEKFQMTDKEQDGFLKAMKDPEFRNLLNEYMQEISDPKNRAEQEMYLRQLENENKVPSDKILVLPKPGFVVKTKHKKKKIFVNVCSSDKMQPPSSTKVIATNDTTGGTSWNLPYCVGPQRAEQDKGGQVVVTFDVCHHPQTLLQAKQNPAFLKMLVNTSLDGVDKALQQLEPSTEKVEREYHVLKGVMYKSGNPVTMCISKARDESNIKEASCSKEKPPTKETSKLEPKSSTSVPTLNSTEQKPMSNSSMLPMIAYQIIQCGKFDLGDHVEKREVSNFRPRELVVKLELPTLNSAAGIDLDVSATCIKLSAKGYEPLEFSLPFPVIESKGTAKFDKANKKLVVTLPVEPIVEQASTKLQPVIEEVKTEEPIDETPVESKVESPKVNEAKIDHSRWIERKDNKEQEDAFSAFREYAIMVQHDKPLITYKEAPIVAEETSSHKSYIIQVPGILPSSIESVETESSIRFRFQANSVYYEFEIENSSILEWEHQLATQNMVIICRKLSPPKEPPFRIHRTEAAISIIVDVSHVATSNIVSKFHENGFTVKFSASNVTYELSRKFDCSLHVEKCIVESADENILITMSINTDTSKVEPPIPDPENSSSAANPTDELDAPSAIPHVPRFTNALMYELD